MAFKSKNLEQTEAQASTNLKTPPNLIDQCQSSSQKPPLNESISIAESKASTNISNILSNKSSDQPKLNEMNSKQTTTTLSKKSPVTNESSKETSIDVSSKSLVSAVSNESVKTIDLIGKTKISSSKPLSTLSVDSTSNNEKVNLVTKLTPNESIVNDVNKSKHETISKSSTTDILNQPKKTPLTDHTKIKDSTSSLAIKTQTYETNDEKPVIISVKNKENKIDNSSPALDTNYDSSNEQITSQLSLKSEKFINNLPIDGSIKKNLESIQSLICESKNFALSLPYTADNQLTTELKEEISSLDTSTEANQKSDENEPPSSEKNLANMVNTLEPQHISFSTEETITKTTTNLDCITDQSKSDEKLVIKQKPTNYCSSICQVAVRFGIFVSDDIEILIRYHFSLFVYLSFFIINALLLKDIIK